MAGHYSGNAKAKGNGQTGPISLRVSPVKDTTNPVTDAKPEQTPAQPEENKREEKDTSTKSHDNSRTEKPLPAGMHPPSTGGNEATHPQQGENHIQNPQAATGHEGGQAGNGEEADGKQNHNGAGSVRKVTKVSCLRHDSSD